ncbi:hypothetical protein [Pectobacterium sp. B2J-2]|uniref:hypothetical protein n=1 Tax=Pectobacterium sp. B2J-2 TaxID=3385372 RepID=UPI0038FBEE70
MSFMLLACWQHQPDCEWDAVLDNTISEIISRGLLNVLAELRGAELALKRTLFTELQQG